MATATYPQIEFMTPQIEEAIEHIYFINTLPPQIDYIQPKWTQEEQEAIAFIETLPEEQQEQVNLIIHMRINDYYESGAAYYNSLF